jgi:hypothetical protein
VLSSVLRHALRIQTSSEAKTLLKLELKVVPDNIQVKEYKKLTLSFKELNSGFTMTKELSNTNTLQLSLPSEPMRSLQKEILCIQTIPVL